MKLSLVLYTACFALLGATASGRPSKHHHSSEESEEVENADLTIIPAAADLFTAILSPSIFWSGHEERGAWAANFCDRVYHYRYLKSVFSRGGEIRDASKISQFNIRRYLRKNDREQLKQQFVQNIEQCGALEESKQRLNCYVQVISSLFNEIERKSISKRRKKSVRRELTELSSKLYAAGTKHDKCLSVLPSETASVPPQGNITTAAPTTASSSGPAVTVEPPGFGDTTVEPIITVEPPGFGDTTVDPIITVEPPGFGDTTVEPIITVEPPGFGDTTVEPIITVEPPGFGDTTVDPIITVEPPGFGDTTPESTITVEPPGFGDTTVEPIITVEPPGFGDTTVEPIITVEPPGFGDTTVDPITTVEPPGFGDTTPESTITVEPPGFGNTTVEPVVTVEPPGFGTTTLEPTVTVEQSESSETTTLEPSVEYLIF